MKQDRNIAAASAPRALARTLLARLDELGFAERCWERARLHLDQFYGEAAVAEIFSLERFDELLTSGSLMSPHLDVVRGGKKQAAAFRVSPSPATDVTRLLADFAAGATIRIPHIEHYLPAISEYCREIEAHFHVPIRANLYCTPKFSQGFAPHYDLDDIFVLQVFGSKTWWLHPEYTDQAPLPNADMGFDAGRHRSSAAPEEVTLETGDVLYLPRGFMHEARTEADSSIHVTFALIGAKVGDLLQQLVRRAGKSMVDLRRLIAFDPVREPGEDAVNDLSAELAAQLHAIVSPDAIRAAAADMRRTMAAHRNPYAKGEAIDILRRR